MRSPDHSNPHPRPAAHLIALLLCGAAQAQSAAGTANAVHIDGRLDPQEWQAARQIDDFLLIEPRTRQPLPYATRAWLLATPQGLALGLRAQQPAGIPRTRERFARDQSASVDRFSVIVDFEGAGHSALAFTVTLGNSILDGTVVNENQYSTDWDGNWSHAVSEDADGWSAEMLLPWHLAPLAAAVDGQRTLRIGISRVIGDTGERVAWPATHLSEPRFLSQLAPLQVSAYEQPLLALTPFVVGLSDLARGGQELDGGLDLFWKPSGRFQLAATLNPDFGQVESDNLVVNFSAVESFFSDRRPFFTENQSAFDLPFGVSNSRLLYTRRVGAGADDGSGAADVNAALKLNGHMGELQYGVFAAQEAGEAGRRFLALRGQQLLGEHRLGLMLTDVDRPFLQRQARTMALDHNWTRGDQFSWRSTVVGSELDLPGGQQHGLGVQSRLDQRFNDRFRHNLYLLHMGDRLELNDFGYLDRNDLNYLRYEVGDRRTGFASGSRYSSIDHRYAVSTRHNTDGMHLYDAAAWYRLAQLADGGTEYAELTVLGPANDDRLLRGNGVARLPTRFFAYYERNRPRKGDWAIAASVAARNEGLNGVDASTLEAAVSPTWYYSDTFSIAPRLSLRHAPDWLLWRGDNRLASFRTRQLSFNTDLNWIISPRSELRIKLETIALRAQARHSYRVGTDRRISTTEPHSSDFSLANLGFQVRWRYELAPLSDLYLVYSRGGLGTSEQSRDLSDLLGDAFTLDNDQQFLIKLSYRFEV